MQFRTPITISPSSLRLDHSHRVVMFGSCFSEHIAERMRNAGFHVTSNPFGIMFNPASIARNIERLATAQPYSIEDLMLSGERWVSFDFHGDFASRSADEAVASMNRAVESGAQALREADTVVLTLGTAWVYRLKGSEEVVGNCHKVPEREFVRCRLTVEEIVEEYTDLLGRLWAVNPKVRVLFTVSPVRHLKDTLHGNQLSKATLLLAVDELCGRYPERLHYFPAYEIVMDELRDYRFYAEDMAHPSAQAVEYVWERFVEQVTDGGARAFMAEWTKMVRALAHRPFRPDAEEYQQFVKQNLVKLMALKERYPYLEVQNEIDTWHTLLKP